MFFYTNALPLRQKWLHEVRVPRDLLGSYVKTLTESQELIKNAREIMETLLEADNVCSECFAKISGDKEKEKGV